MSNLDTLKRRVFITLASPLALAMCVTLGPVTASAQNQSEEPLEEIIVTSRYREENLQETPIAITACLSVRLVCKAGEGVLARLGRDNGEFEMVLARCSIFEPSAEQLEKRRQESGIPFWPHAFVTAHCDIDQLIEAWGNEYAVLGYGDHLYDELVAFCELTGIKTIAL